MTTISVAELEENEKRLEKEIQEKQQLLDSIRRTREYIQHGPRELAQTRNGTTAPSGTEYGKNTRLVRGAIEAMTKNYTFKDIRAFLAGAGTPLSTEAINVVINRLKRVGEIKEFRKGKGRRAAIYKV
jgi:hypothetical protein